MPSPSPPPSVGRRASGRRVPGTVRCADGAEESVLNPMGEGSPPWSIGVGSFEKDQIGPGAVRGDQGYPPLGCKK